MRPSALAPWALCLALGLLPAGGFVLHLELDCSLAADGRVLWANWTVAFNKMAFLCYAADFQEFVPCGLGYYPDWDAAAGQLSEQLDQLLPAWGRSMEDACRQQMGPLWGAAGARRTPPNVLISPISPLNTPAPVMLACHVWGFYPPDVRVTWLRNGAFVKNSSATPVVSNGDWTYQTRLSLPVQPRGEDVYTCSVDHGSLQEPLKVDWEPGLTPEVKVKVGVSAAMLGVGVVFLLAGIICWNRRAPEGYAPIEGSNYPPVDS